MRSARSTRRACGNAQRQMSPETMPLEPLNPMPSSLLKHYHTVRAPRISDHSVSRRHTKKEDIRCTQTSTKAEVTTANSYGTKTAYAAAMESPCARCERRLPQEMPGISPKSGVMPGRMGGYCPNKEGGALRTLGTIFPQCGKIFRIRSQPNGP